jgi:hypothetical protein
MASQKTDNRDTNEPAYGRLPLMQPKRQLLLFRNFGRFTEKVTPAAQGRSASFFWEMSEESEECVNYQRPERHCARAFHAAHGFFYDRR